MDHDALANRFSTLLAGYGLDDATPVVTGLDEALERAALAGAFNLYRIVAFAAQADRPALRQALEAASEEASVPDRRLRWLKQDRRKLVLAGLFEDAGRLTGRLASLRLDAADAEGRMLRDLLRRGVPDLGRVSDARLGPLITVLGWLEGLQPPGLTALLDARAARLEQTRRERKRGWTAQLANGFFGRKAELDHLVKVLTREGDAGAIVLFAGPGGIGKSALLARAVQKIGKERPQTPIFTFDFDRPTLDPRGPGLTLEFTRQLALLLPDCAARLSEIRNQSREIYWLGGGEALASQRGMESASKADSEAGYKINQIIRERGLDRQTALVVFDTLEVVMAQGDYALRALSNWLTFLSYNLGMMQARFVMAGRAAEAAAPILGGAAEVWQIPPLANTEAVSLLRRMGVTARRAAEAAVILGGNPLVLRLGGRFLLEHPDLPASELAEGGAGEVALTQGVLYRRILQHVGTGPNDPLRRLAYPGLALRVVTPALIARVVAPAIGMAVDSDEVARNYLDRLIGQAWLVERETPRRARHRRDLREVMLRLMRRDDADRVTLDVAFRALIPANVARAGGTLAELYDHAMAQLRRGNLLSEQVALDAAYQGLVARNAALPGGTLRALQERALAQFRRNDDPDLPKDRAALEAVYHALMLLKPGEDLEPSDRALVSRALTGDYSDLSDHAAALARFHTAVPLSAADLPLLPEAYRELAIAELGWRAIDAERPDEASALPSPGPVPRVWQLTAWQDAGAWHLPEVGAALAPGRFALSGISAQDSRFATLLQRERQSAGLAVAAWLRLWRGDVEAVAAPDSAVMQSFDSLEVRERTLVLRAGAAFGLACLLRGDLSAESWDALEFLSGTAPTAGGTTVDPTLADEIARLRLLVWQAGRLQPEARIPLRAAMFAPTPEIQTQMVALVPLVGPQVPGASAQLLVVRAQIQTIVDQLPKDAPSSVLTGRFTQSIVEIIEGAGGCTLASLGAAGIAAADLVQGMMPELRPAARNALRQVLGVAVKQPIAEGIAKALAESSETYLPSDLQPKAWSAAIMADDDKAVHAMVDWAMRRGKLGVVLLAAADLTSGEAEARLRRVGAAGSLVQQAFSAAAVLATPIAT